MTRTFKIIFMIVFTGLFLVTCTNHKTDLDKNEAFVSLFIKSLRTVTLNNELQKKMVSFVLFSLNEKSNAFNNIMDYYEINDPFERNKKEEVEINITDIVRRDLKSYMVKWQEKRVNHIEHKYDHKSFESIVDIDDQIDSLNRLLNKDDFSCLYVNNISIRETADVDKSFK